LDKAAANVVTFSGIGGYQQMAHGIEIDLDVGRGVCREV